MVEKIEHPGIPDGHILTLGHYRPWWYHKNCGGDGLSYPTYSGRLLDLKESRERGIKYFMDVLADNIRTNAELALVVVPSHDSTKVRSGVHQLVTRFAPTIRAVDAGASLIRTKTIQKLANGGDRSIQVHLGSMAADDMKSIGQRNVMLIDDIMTTGNSLAAGRQILMEAGAVDVLCVALGRTSYE